MPGGCLEICAQSCPGQPENASKGKKSLFCPKEIRARRSAQKRHSAPPRRPNSLSAVPWAVSSRSRRGSSFCGPAPRAPKTAPSAPWPAKQIRCAALPRGLRLISLWAPGGLVLSYTRLVLGERSPLGRAAALLARCPPPTTSNLNLLCGADRHPDGDQSACGI
jgi:hypothetical protein